MEIRRRPPNPKVKVANLEYAIPHSDSEPRNILEEILWEKDREIKIARDRVPLDKLKAQAKDLAQTKDFFGALKEGFVACIAFLLPFVKICQVTKKRITNGINHKAIDLNF